MKIVIDIPEEMYNMACKYPEMVLAGYPLCIKNGTPQEPCEDCISRQAVEDTIINYRWKYSALYKSIKQLPSVTPQPKMGYISIDDVMAVFDDFMRGDVDENNTETFLEILKDKAEGSEE